jgi:hypothetical protein
MIILKLNKDIKVTKGRLMKAGSKIELECDENKMPLDRFWRDRLKDSAIDNCVELEVINKKKKSK